MVKTEYEIRYEEGLHARPASDLCKEANRFKSSVTISKDGEDYDAKSVLMVLCMGAVKGDIIEIRAEGEDENEALEAVIKSLDTE